MTDPPVITAPETINHDQDFKELISTFFMEFLELFLPEVASTIDGCVAKTF